MELFLEESHSLEEVNLGGEVILGGESILRGRFDSWMENKFLGGSHSWRGVILEGNH
jgi:hypothetical protein